MQVDDKYQYSMDNKDGGVHGWISTNPIVGFWTIFPSHEFRNGGPTKQNLTAHTGPACLAVIFSFSSSIKTCQTAVYKIRVLYRCSMGVTTLEMI